MRLPDLRRFLLGLMGPQIDSDFAGQLSSDGWRKLNEIAAQHRLQPHLHARVTRGEIALDVPGAIRDSWQVAHRRNALRTLSQRRSLAQVHDILSDAGIACVALKGACLAWNHYPAAAERPMRDIDVLIPPDRILEALALLSEHGLRQESASARTPEEALEHDKHLPPMVDADGTRFELHMRLWEKDSSIDWWMPAPEDQAILARAEPPQAEDPVLSPCAEDMLVHLIIHASFSNRLNGGPLLLADIEYLLSKHSIVWPAFWERSRAGRWERGAALVLALVDRWRQPGLLEASQCSLMTESDILDAAPDLLLQDLNQRKTIGLVAGFAAAFETGGVKNGGRKFLARLLGAGRGRHAPEQSDTVENGYGRWLSSRLGESLTAWTDPDVRRIAAKTRALGTWLSDGDGSRP
ncbi:nucleotidyltransferase domain-containing protein [Parerythrobacter jejuensis]|uniref:Nucleotidyltransferase family protein n=1 Tax=Parerythrobacter jejuensis TaxID=795812 RepID=A0A845ALH1_9SPHN|nr:nucleotidyltransferase family protein [Parerythrobacter jejuensis]MXP31110.1 hypothetical protein [Parerythrobacter jejuensis]MXP33870.1 hypothetical protein [Parerythrobacter jejuensis]